MVLRLKAWESRSLPGLTGFQRVSMAMARCTRRAARSLSCRTGDSARAPGPPSRLCVSVTGAADARDVGRDASGLACRQAADFNTSRPGGSPGRRRTALAQRTETRIAVAGAGLAGRGHVETVSRAARLDAVIDPDPETSRIAERHGADWHPDLAGYLRSGRPDGVIVATPNHLHQPLATACLKAGVPVLVEKPLADGVAGARSLVQAAGETGVPALVGHHRRHSPVAEAARDVIAGGRIGRVVAVNAMFWLNKHDGYFNSEWRARAGGGPIRINLIHDIDLLQHFCGPITSVQARSAHHARGLEVEDTGAMIFEFASGALGTASVCDATSAPWSWEMTAGEKPGLPSDGPVLLPGRRDDRRPFGSRSHLVDACRAGGLVVADQAGTDRRGA